MCRCYCCCVLLLPLLMMEHLVLMHCQLLRVCHQMPAAAYSLLVVLQVLLHYLHCTIVDMTQSNEAHCCMFVHCQQL